jgi:hypothetical protein
MNQDHDARTKKKKMMMIQIFERVYIINPAPPISISPSPVQRIRRTSWLISPGQQPRWRAFLLPEPDISISDGDDRKIEGEGSYAVWWV